MRSSSRGSLLRSAAFSASSPRLPSSLRMSSPRLPTLSARSSSPSALRQVSLAVSSVSRYPLFRSSMGGGPPCVSRLRACDDRTSAWLARRLYGSTGAVSAPLHSRLARAGRRGLILAFEHGRADDPSRDQRCQDEQAIG